MILSEDYKNIVKLRFKSPEKMGDDFFNELNSALTNPENFDVNLFSKLSLNELLDYLKKSHAEYLTVWFPKIELLVKDIQKDLGINDITLTLKSFVVNYYNELTNHINFEEKVLYNFVEKILKGIYIEKEKVFVLNHFLETHNHDVTEELLTIQKVLINKDSTLKDNNLVQELFYKLNIIQNDLTLHGIIEDELFISKIHTYIEDNF